MRLVCLLAYMYAICDMHTNRIKYKLRDARDVPRLLCVNLLHDYRFSITAIQQLHKFSPAKRTSRCTSPPFIGQGLMGQL